MLRVIHCITTITRGGAENQLLILSKEQIKSGRRVTIIYLNGKPELRQDFIDSGIEVLDFLSQKNPILQIVYLRKYLKTNKGIVHAHLPRAELFCAAVNLINPLVISKHNSEPFFPKAPKIISKLLALFVSYKSDQCITISQAVADYLTDTNELLTYKSYTVIHYGILDELIEQKNINIVNNAKNIRVGTIGRVVKQKDYPTLIKGFSLFHSEYTDSELIIIGDGVLKYKIMKLAQKLKIESDINWYGRTPDVHFQLKKMDVFVLASKYEGFGLVLLEAMAAKVPIIAANNSAIAEVLGLNYPGLFTTGDEKDLYMKLKQFMLPEFKEKILRMACDRLINFKSSDMRKKVDFVYDSAIFSKS